MHTSPATIPGHWDVLCQALVQSTSHSELPCFLAPHPVHSAACPVGLKLAQEVPPVQQVWWAVWPETLEASHVVPRQVMVTLGCVPGGLEYPLPLLYLGHSERNTQDQK